MVLQGKTDRITLAKNPPTVDLRVYVGTKKKPSTKNSNKLIFGDDLVDKFRLDPINPSIINYLKYICDPKTLLTPSLKIIFAFDDPEKTFDCKAQKWSEKEDKLTGCLWKCDRVTIYQRKVAIDTPYGVSPQFIETNDPCHLKGQPGKCPKGCQETGTLYFYIPELLGRGHQALCSLVVSGEFNIRGLARKLTEIQENFGTIKSLPFGMPESHNAVLFNLGRYSAMRQHPIFHEGLRTGKTKDKLTHLVSLSIDQYWLTNYRNMEKVFQMQKLGYRPDMKLIQQVSGDELLPPGQVSSLTSASSKLGQPKPGRASIDTFKQKLAIAYRENAWNKDGWEAMMLSYFNSTEISENLDLDTLLAIASTKEEQRKWCKF